MKIVLFDLDGTIADTIPMCIAAFRKAVEPYVLRQLSQEEIVQAFGLNEEGMIKQVAGIHWEEALHDFYIHYTDMHKTWCPTPFDGIRKLISDLKNSGMKVALVTGKGARSCAITLNCFGMQDDFDFVETGAPDKNRKPEAIRYILHKSHTPCEEATYIGDTVSDVLSCREAGIVCLSAAWAKGTRHEDLEKVNKDHVFHSVPALKSWLYRTGCILSVFYDPFHFDS